MKSYEDKTDLTSNASHPQKMNNTKGIWTICLKSNETTTRMVSGRKLTFRFRDKNSRRKVSYRQTTNTATHSIVQRPQVNENECAGHSWALNTCVDKTPPWINVVDSVLSKACFKDPNSVVRHNVHNISFDLALRREATTLSRNSNTFSLDKLRGYKASLILFLYKDAFICRNMSSAKPDGNAQPYTRSSRNFLRSIDMGFIPYDLANQAPCTFYDGKIIAEIHDFRDKEMPFPRSSSAIGKLQNEKGEDPPSYVRKVLLQPTADMMAHKIEELVKHERTLSNDMYPLQILAEQKILNSIYTPRSLCLDPSIDVAKVASALYYNGRQTRYRRCCDTFRYRRLENISTSVASGPIKPTPGANKRKKSTPTASKSASQPSANKKQSVSSPAVATTPLCSIPTTQSAGDVKGSPTPAPVLPVKIEKPISTEPLAAPPSLIENSNTPLLPTTSTTATGGVDFILGLEEFQIGLNASSSEPLQPNVDLNLLRPDNAGEADLEFLGSLLNDSATVELSLPSDEKIEQDISRLPEFIEEQTHSPLEFTTKSSGPLSSEWFHAASTLQRRLKEAAEANVNHIRSVQPIANDAAGRVGSITHLAQKLGKARWPNEVISLARGRRQQNMSSESITQPSPLRGLALAETEKLLE